MVFFETDDCCYLRAGMVLGHVQEKPLTVTPTGFQVEQVKTCPTTPVRSSSEDADADACVEAFVNEGIPRFTSRSASFVAPAKHSASRLARDTRTNFAAEDARVEALVKESAPKITRGSSFLA